MTVYKSSKHSDLRLVMSYDTCMHLWFFFSVREKFRVCFKTNINLKKMLLISRYSMSISRNNLYSVTRTIYSTKK